MQTVRSRYHFSNGFAALGRQFAGSLDRSQTEFEGRTSNDYTQACHEKQGELFVAARI